MTTEEGNVIIAEFMGGKFHAELNAPWRFEVQPNKYLREDARIMNLLYDSDWNWLMPVVEKISEYRLAHTEQSNEVCNCKIVIEIEPLWRKVIDFIQWYNEYKSKQQER